MPQHLSDKRNVTVWNLDNCLRWKCVYELHRQVIDFLCDYLYSFFLNGLLYACTYFPLTCVPCPPQVTAVWTRSVQWVTWHRILTLSTDSATVSAVSAVRTGWSGGAGIVYVTATYPCYYTCVATTAAIIIMLPVLHHLLLVLWPTTASLYHALILHDSKLVTGNTLYITDVA